MPCHWRWAGGKEWADSKLNKPTDLALTVGSRKDDTVMDEAFDTVIELYTEAHGEMPKTGGQAVDWAVNEKLITDDQRDYFYLFGGI